MGAVLLVSGSRLALGAMAANAYFSAVVRIQTDRGHVVVMSGPYRLVRHPGYLGAVLHYPGVALILALLNVIEDEELGVTLAAAVR